LDNRFRIRSKHRHMIKVTSTLHQLAREWSAEGAVSRCTTLPLHHPATEPLN